MFVLIDFIPGISGSLAREIGQEAVLRMKHYMNLVHFTKKQSKTSPFHYQSNSTSRIDLLFNDVVQIIPGAIANINTQFYPDQPLSSAKVVKAFKTYLQ